MPMVGSDKVIFAYRRNKMTRELTIRSLDIPSIHKIAVGFDNLFDELNRLSSVQTQNYPPHNVIKHTDDRFTIEVAVAGFGESELDVSLDNNALIISGSKVREEMLNYEYLHRGLSSRDFTQTFQLAEHVEVIHAEVKNGILSVYLERKVPEEKKPKSIAITYTK
jgi:molecular chaperone IbpA